MGGDVPARGEEALTAVRARPRLQKPREARVTLPSESGVLEQELEEADEVVRAPPTLLVRLAETDRAMGRDAREEPVVEDVEPDGRPGAEAAHGAVRQPRLERAALEPAEDALDDRERDAREQGAPRSLRGDRVAGGAHSRTDPTPGTNGGLWWNGTRFAMSFSACQWISPITCTGISG